jgi:hypothetical protein
MAGLKSQVCKIYRAYEAKSLKLPGIELKKVEEYEKDPCVYNFDIFQASLPGLKATYENSAAVWQYLAEIMGEDYPQKKGGGRPVYTIADT